MGKYEFGDFSKREEAYTDVMGVWQTSLNTMKRSKSKHERTTSSISSPILPDFPRSDLPANIASESTNEASTVKEQNDSQKSPANPSMVTKPSMEFSKSSSGLADASKKGDGTEINQLTSKSKPPLPIPIPDRAAPSTTLVDVNVTSYPVVPMRQQSLHQSTLPSKPLPETQPQASTSSSSSSPIPVASATSPLPPLPLLNGQVPRKTTMNELFRSLGRKMKVGLDKDGVNGAGSGHGTPTGMASGVVSGNGSSAALIVGTPPSISVASDSTLVQALSTPPKSTDNRLEKAVNESAPPTDSSLPSQAPAGEPPITKPTIVYPPAPIPFDFEPFYKHVVLNEIIPLEINILWELVWSDRNNEVLKEAHKRRETEGVKIGEWKVVGDGSEVEKKGRELGYSVMYKMPMQPKKWAQCTETQTITKFDPL
ncbi:hypothetical protein BKA69DRAFT_493671 [Paraphysoderma sedebokerense]|nr:hypothetical protein BKA69DRAFT_493671 [Paraphysoderma sedebokerense]